MGSKRAAGRVRTVKRSIVEARVHDYKANTEAHEHALRAHRKIIEGIASVMPACIKSARAHREDEFSRVYALWEDPCIAAIVGATATAAAAAERGPVLPNFDDYVFSVCAGAASVYVSTTPGSAAKRKDALMACIGAVCAKAPVIERMLFRAWQDRKAAAVAHALDTGVLDGPGPYEPDADIANYTETIAEAATVASEAVWMLSFGAARGSGEALWKTELALRVLVRERVLASALALAEDEALSTRLRLVCWQALDRHACTRAATLYVYTQFCRLAANEEGNDIVVAGMRGAGRTQTTMTAHIQTVLSERRPFEDLRAVVSVGTRAIVFFDTPLFARAAGMDVEMARACVVPIFRDAVEGMCAASCADALRATAQSSRVKGWRKSRWVIAPEETVFLPSWIMLDTDNVPSGALVAALMAAGAGPSVQRVPSVTAAWDTFPAWVPTLYFGALVLRTEVHGGIRAAISHLNVRRAVMGITDDAGYYDARAALHVDVDMRGVSRYCPGVGVRKSSDTKTKRVVTCMQLSPGDPSAASVNGLNVMLAHDHAKYASEGAVTAARALDRVARAAAGGGVAGAAAAVARAADGLFVTDVFSGEPVDSELGRVCASIPEYTTFSGLAVFAELALRVELARGAADIDAITAAREQTRSSRSRRRMDSKMAAAVDATKARIRAAVDVLYSLIEAGRHATVIDAVKVWAVETDDGRDAAAANPFDEEAEAAARLSCNDEPLAYEFKVAGFETAAVLGGRVYVGKGEKDDYVLDARDGETKEKSTEVPLVHVERYVFNVLQRAVACARVPGTLFFDAGATRARLLETRGERRRLALVHNTPLSELVQGAGSVLSRIYREMHARGM